MWKRNSVLLILFVLLGLVFTTTTPVQADSTTSTYDVTILSGESGSHESNSQQPGANNQYNNHHRLPKTGITNRLPQLNDQQVLALIYGGLLLIIILVIMITRQISSKRRS